MSFFSSSDLLNFLRFANTREVQDVIVELSEHVYIYSVEWHNRPVRLNPEGDTVVEDTYHADYCSSPACTITVVTNDGGIFKIDIKVREEIGIHWEEFEAIVYQYREWYDAIPNIRSNIAFETNYVAYVNEVDVREVKPNETYGLTINDINAILKGAYRFEIISNETMVATLLAFD